MPALSTQAAFQDMTSLIEGGRAGARWQAFFIPSPAGAIEKAGLAFGNEADRSRMPRGAGLHGGDGTVYTMDTARPLVDSPDEARVTRGQKGGRVIAVAPQAPPKAFSAGSILERQSLLRPGANIGGADVRSAFARQAAPEKSIEVAMLFAPKRPDILDVAPTPGVMMASLAPPSAPPSTALGYAPAQSGIESRAATLFGKILKSVPKSFIPPLGEGDHAWAATPLPISAYSAKEQTCLANGIYFEARGESELGQAAVAQVMLNRVRNPSYPKSICGVVYQNKHWRNRCQFSFACDGIKDKITNKRSYSEALRIAGEVTRGDTWIAEVGSSTHYHATYVAPRWANAMKKVDKIGRHIFYRTFGGGWN
ncbi:cell wall hydrolase [Aureimonas sp. SA4125]|uniref:cell wall hydrolase n=1 Tax=Aureimonas sp. SA4125 TaxID=2826993 RepID=UPI001CC5AABB|nr:cell wall hydrolase [Aureimonas sp. SA4125]